MQSIGLLPTLRVLLPSKKKVRTGGALAAGRQGGGYRKALLAGYDYEHKAEARGEGEKALEKALDVPALANNAQQAERQEEQEEQGEEDAKEEEEVATNLPSGGYHWGE
jgi:hypothetical protein